MSPESGARELAGGLRARRFDGVSGLREVRAPWMALVDEGRADPLCNDPDWTLAHAAGFGRADEYFGWLLEDAGGAPVAVLPFRREPSRGALALRRAILAGGGTFDSDYLDLVVRPGEELASATAALDLLASERGVDAAVLSCVPDDSPVLAALTNVLKARGLPSRTRPEPCCATALPEDFDAFLATLKKRMRTKVRSAMRKATESGAELRWIEEEGEIEPALDLLFRLHQQRWNEAGEPGSFAGPERRAFYRELAPDLLRRGRLGLAQLVRDGRVLATQIGAVVDETYYQIQEGYDPDLAEERLGIALRGLAIRALIDRGVRSYDFMAGVTRGKTDWGAALRPCTTIAFPVSGVRARLAYGLRAFVDARRGQG